MVGIGIGGITSNALAGWLIDRAGTDLPYLAGGLGGIALGLAVTWILPAPAGSLGAPHASR
jgi:hypothetical protein